MRTLRQDLRFGLRVLWDTPGFTVVALLTLALGIAVNTTVFSWIDTVLLRPLPGVTDGHQLVTFETIQPDGEGHNTSYADFRDYRDHLTLSTLAVSLQPNALNIGEGDRTQRVWGELVSGNYFAVLGVKPFLGRFFLPEEQGDQPGAYPVAVISYRLWRNSFKADRSVAGSTVLVNRQPLTLIGVAPPEFRGNERGLEFDLWTPLMMGPELGLVNAKMFEQRKNRSLQGIARLKPGVTIGQAREEVAAVARHMAAANPATNTGFGATLLEESEAHGVRSLLLGPLKILMAMSLVVLLIACVNVANVLLARSIARQKEFSIRLALGAGRGRLVRQLLTEALLLAGLGAVAGVPLAMWMQQSLSYLAPVSIGLPIGLDIRMSGAVLAFSVAVSLAAALVSGISPALHAIRPDVSDTLKECGRGATAGAGSHRMRGLFVISEVALALVALVGAGLFVRSFQMAVAIHPGFDLRDVLVSRFYFSASGYTPEQWHQFCFRLRDRLASAPGIVAVSYADMIPLGFGMGPGSDLQIEGYVPAPAENMTIGRTLAAPGYFGLMRIPLLAGRDFTDQDDRNTAPVLVVNESFARRFFAGRDPVGRQIRAWGRWSTVVGLVKDSKYYHLGESPRPYFYAPVRQIGGGGDVAFYVRTSGHPTAALAAIRSEAAAIDPNAGGFDAMPLADFVAAPLFPRRIAASLLSALGGLSLVLAAIGLYSVMAYAVSQRTHEMGIRLALGAPAREVVGMVMRQGLILSAADILAGTAVALAATRLVTGMLLNVCATDPLVFAGAAVFLGLVALFATYLPARRATRVDPMVALRHS